MITDEGAVCCHTETERERELSLLGVPNQCDESFCPPILSAVNVTNSIQQ